MNRIIRRITPAVTEKRAAEGRAPSPARRRLLQAGVGVLPSVYTLNSGAQVALQSTLACINQQPQDIKATFIRETHDNWLRWHAIEAEMVSSTGTKTPVYCVPNPSGDGWDWNDPVSSVTYDNCFVFEASSSQTSGGSTSGTSRRGRGGGRKGGDTTTTTTSDSSTTTTETETSNTTGTTGGVYKAASGTRWIKSDGTLLTAEETALIQLDEATFKANRDKKLVRFSYVTVDDQAQFRNSALDTEFRNAMTGSCWASIYPNA
jgi:hypothetical protein